MEVVGGLLAILGALVAVALAVRSHHKKCGCYPEEGCPQCDNAACREVVRSLGALRNDEDDIGGGR